MALGSKRRRVKRGINIFLVKVPFFIFRMGLYSIHKRSCDIPGELHRWVFVVSSISSVLYAQDRDFLSVFGRLSYSKSSFFRTHRHTEEERPTLSSVGRALSSSLLFLLLRIYRCTSELEWNTISFVCKASFQITFPLFEKK